MCSKYLAKRDRKFTYIRMQSSLNNLLISLTSQTILGPKMLDPNTIMIQDWIREYNNHSGLATSERSLLTTRLILFFNFLTLFLIVGLIIMRLQVLMEI